MYINFSLIASTLMIVLLIWVSIHDFKHHAIENYVHPIIIFLSIFISEVGLSERLIGATFCLLPILAVNIVSKGGIGMGDVKLTAAFGFALGANGGLLCLLIGFLLISIFGIILYILKKRKNPIPFAPFLCSGFIFSMAIYQITF